MKLKYELFICQSTYPTFIPNEKPWFGRLIIPQFPSYNTTLKGSSQADIKGKALEILFAAKKEIMYYAIDVTQESGEF